MLRISWQTLRTRRGSLAGAFAAILLAVAFASATGAVLAAALSAPGPGRFAAADAVLRADPTVDLGGDEGGVDAVPGPRADGRLAERAAAVDGVKAAVGDVAFDVTGWAAGRAAGSGLRAHGWPSARLTPYALTAGRAPARAGEIVADAKLDVRPGARLRIAAPGGTSTYRVTGVARSRAAEPVDQTAVFFTADVAGRLSGTPGRVDAVGVLAEPGVSRSALRERLLAAGLGKGVEVVDRDHAADADAGDSRAEDRATVIAVSGTMGGITGVVALFVVAGTFSLVMAQRRREIASMLALGATGRQIRRLVSGEALIVAVAAGALGLAAGIPLAGALVDVLASHDVVPEGFQAGGSWIPPVAAFALGVVISQLAVVAAAHRAGRTAPAEAMREVAVERSRPSVVQLLTGVVLLGGGVAMSLVFSGFWAQAFAVLCGMLLAAGVGMLGRGLLGGPATLASWPLRALGAPGLLASANLGANRWRTAALATPIVLIAMLAGTQGVVQTSDQRHTERVTAARVTADHVVTGRDGAPVPERTAADVAALPGVRGVAEVLPTQVFGLDHGLAGESPWTAAGVRALGRGGALDLGVVRGDLRDVRGTGVAISKVVAHDGKLGVGDSLRVRLADTTPATLRVAAVYDRAAGLGDVVVDSALARAHTPGADPATVFVSGGSPARYADRHPELRAADRDAYLGALEVEDTDGAWAVWLIVGVAAVFATLSLVNTAAMATGERRQEMATIRLVGGTPGQITRMAALEMLPTIAVAVAAGAAVVAVAVAGVPRSVSGVPLEVPLTLTAGLLGGAALLGLLAGVVTSRLALRSSPAEAMRARE